MHCVDPACTNACMLGALKKREHGIVSYDPNLCIGCRYCQMACPFNVPKFEWAKAAPKIVKCELCRHRAEGAALAKTDGFSRYPKGHGPACAEVCPREAVISGTSDELLSEAKRRIAANPDRYAVPEGSAENLRRNRRRAARRCSTSRTCPFEKLGLPDLGKEPGPRSPADDPARHLPGLRRARSCSTASWARSFPQPQEGRRGKAGGERGES